MTRRVAVFRRHLVQAALVLAALVPAASTRLAGQTPVAELGVRLRVTTISPARRTSGILAGLAADSLTLVQRETGSTLRWTLDDIRSVEISRGRHSFVGRGAVRGLVGGTLLGGARFLGSCLNDDCHEVVELLVANAALGLFVGGVIGAVMRIERWRPVTIAEIATMPAVEPGAAVASPFAGLGVLLRMTVTGEDQPLEGTLVSATSDSIALQPRGGGPVLNVPRTSLARLEVARGTRGHTVEGALVGAAVTAAAGYALGASIEEDGFIDTDGPTLAVLGALVGTLPGAIVGSLIKRQRWESAPVTFVPEIGPAPGGGVRLGIRIPIRP